MRDHADRGLPGVRIGLDMERGSRARPVLSFFQQSFQFSDRIEVFRAAGSTLGSNKSRQVETPE